MEQQENSLGRWISLLDRYSAIYINQEVADLGLGKGQVLFLMELYKQDGVFQEELAQRLNIDKGTTTRALHKLEETDFIRRETCDYDRRSNKVFLTKKARKAEEDVIAILKNWTSILGKDLSTAEIHSALRLLEKMADNATEYIDGSRKNKQE